MADPDQIDTVADAFQAEIQPQRAPQPRNDRGQFTENLRPERMLEARQIEGDPLTGDTRDGGDDPRLRAREKSVEEQDDGLQGTEGAPEGDTEAPEGDTETPDEGDEDQEEYEVVVDGEPKRVKLQEALDGYIRTETFHQRMNKLSEAAQVVNQEAQKNAQLREYWLQQNQALEQELQALIPKEPDWDAEFARDPQAAHSLQKQFEALKSKLGEIRQQRAVAQQQMQQESAQSVARFAASEREKFLNRYKLATKEVQDREIAAMRKTAMTEGFSEDEIAQVYDSRMLSVLMKASKYDRMMAVKPKAVIPGKGKTLTPGSVNGRSRSGREGNNAAQKLAQSGSLEDAAGFFETLLR